MKGHGQFCPVAVASDVFAHRWTPLIIRELLAGSSRFNEIRRGLPLIPKATLVQRLEELEAAGAIRTVRDDMETHARYELTTAGAEFGAVVQALGEWGQRWGRRFDRGNLDAELLMWNVRRRLDGDRLPKARTVVRVEFSGLPAGYRRTRIFWLIVEKPDADLCIKDPGLDVDLHVAADIGAFARVWLGDRTFANATAAREIRLSGRRELMRAFPAWLKLSHFSDVARGVGKADTSATR